MTTTREDIFTRLNLVLDDWNTQMSRTHEALSRQIGFARGQLDKMRQPSAASGQQPDVEGEDAEHLETALLETRAALTARERELQEAAGEVERLSGLLEHADAGHESVPPQEGEAEVLRSALEMLQLEHAQANDEIRALKQALEERSDAFVPRISGEIEAFDARGHKKRMGELLVELGVLTEVQLKTLLKEQAADPQRRLGTLAVEHGLAGEQLIARILAAQLRLPYLALADAEVDTGAIEAVSAHVVRLHRCVPLQKDGDELTVAMVNPLDLIAIEDLELASRCSVAPVVTTPTAIGALLQKHYPDAS